MRTHNASSCFTSGARGSWPLQPDWEYEGGFKDLPDFEFRARRMVKSMGIESTDQSGRGSGARHPGADRDGGTFS